MARHHLAAAAAQRVVVAGPARLVGVAPAAERRERPRLPPVVAQAVGGRPPGGRRGEAAAGDPAIGLGADQEVAGGAAALIAADHPIVSAFSDEANQRRYWEIAGFARVPCGGTHLKRTGEIGAITLKRVNIGKGKERIEIRICDA